MITLSVSALPSMAQSPPTTRQTPEIAPPPAPALSGNQWQLKFAEEFDGTAYDHSKLTPCFDWNYGDCTVTFNQGYERYLPSQVAVSNGTAKLVAAPLSPAYSSSGCYDGSCIYKAGLLSTARRNAGNGSAYLYKFTYGYVEARMKFPATQGFFTAFWLLPADPSYSYSDEIDIMEVLGHDPKTIHMTYHYNNRSKSYAANDVGGLNGACAAIDYSLDFHTYAVDWQADHIAWYIDGIKCGEFSGSGRQIPNMPMQIILNQMVSNNWQRRVGKPLLDTTLTRQLEVDYLRVWQQAANSSPAPGSAAAPVTARAQAPVPTVAGFPDASTTGVPRGTVLTEYTGPTTISTDGTVIANKIISGTIRIKAANVVVKNSKLTYNDYFGIDAENASNLTVQDCEIVGPGDLGASPAVILGSGTFLRNNISGGEHGIVLSVGPSVIKGNYLHNGGSNKADPHIGGISVKGGQSGVLIEDNTIFGRDTSDVFLQNQFGPISNVTINHNYLAGDPGYNIYVEGRFAKGPVTGVSITNNYIIRGHFGFYSVVDAKPAISNNTEVRP
jgi:beta-glucanase (GH16 family)